MPKENKPHPFKRSTIALLLQASLATGALMPMHMTYAAEATAAEAKIYAIAAGPLGAALSTFATQAGVLLSFDPVVTQGKTTTGLNGSYTISQGFDVLLKGSGLAARQERDGGYALTNALSPQAKGEDILPEVSVRTRREKANDRLVTEGTGSYAASGASMLKGVDSLKDIPQSVTVMTRQRIDDQRLDTLADVLANTPGVTLVKRTGGGSDIYSRGFQTNIIQYDGVPLSRSYTNGNLLLASSVYLDRVEVLRGAQGLLEGAGSPAGAINLVRKRGLAETSIMAEGRAGSWDNYGARIDAGGALNEAGSIRGRAVLDYEDKNSFIDKVWDRNLNAYAAIDIDVAPDTTIGAGIAFSRLNGNSSLYYGLPRYADGTTLPISRKANLDADWSEATRRETQLFLDLEHRFNADWTLKAAGVYTDEEYDAVTALSYFRLVPVNGNSMTAPGFEYDFGGKSKGFNANVNGKLQAFGMTHEVVLGANYSDQERRDAFHEYSNTTVNVFDHQAAIPKLDSRVLSRTRNLSSDTTQKGIYALWRSHLTERMTLIVGGRASWYKYASSIVNPVNGAIVTSSNEKESGEVTPYGGLVYALTPQWSLYASYTEIFEPQSALDTQLKVLQPMTGVNYEAGVKGELFDGALNASLAIFRVDQKNRAVIDYDAPMICGGSYCSRSAGKVRSEGFEIEAHGLVASGWQVSGGYTYNRNKYLEDSDESLVGKPFSYETPRHMLRLWSDYQLQGALDKWRVGLGVNYRNEQKTDSDTMLNPVQGSYAVWNARVGYQIDKNWSASMNADNLFNKEYYSFISNNYLNNYVGEPRKVLLTLRYKF
ncbi:TonB-dependent siderophore receptor [Methylobacillus flagellatus]|uniref:TonB-dependent siderophore receptor n=1 Tax=Methylobacillus flagellatus TaxID=405 RepID=UPI0028686C0A|nr:TonB-dependent siderophore receptor [Methylobacillus flagellatus]